MNGSNAKLQGLKVLVIDDSKTIRRSGRAVAVILERLLHHVQLGRRVVNDQDQGHDHHLPIWVSIADNSSSLVKGLVR